MNQNSRAKTPLLNTRYDKSKSFKSDYDDFLKTKESPERQRPSNDKRPKDLFNVTLQNYANQRPKFKIIKQNNIQKNTWNFDTTKDSLQNMNQKYRSLSTQKFLPKISTNSQANEQLNISMFKSLQKSLGTGKIKVKKKKKSKSKGHFTSQQSLKMQRIGFSDNKNNTTNNYNNINQQQEFFQVQNEYNQLLSKGEMSVPFYNNNNLNNQNNQHNNSMQGSGGKNCQKGRQFEFEETKYDESGTYKVKKPMEMEKLEDFLLNRKSQQEKDKFQYNEILNTAKYLELESSDQMIFFKDLLLYALQGNICIDGDYYYNIRYWLSNQFRFLNASTMEKYKLHPQIEQIKDKIAEKKKDIRQKLNPVTEKDVIIYIDKKQGDKNVELKEDKFMQCEKAVRDLQLLSKISVLMQYKDIILEMTRPPKRWEIFYDDLRKKIIFVNQDDDSERFLNPSHNEISHKAQNSDKHIIIDKITEQDIKIYFGYQKEQKISKEKREYIEKIFGWMHVTENIYKEHSKYILDEIQHFQKYYYGVKFIQDNIIQVYSTRNSIKIKLENKHQQKPNELRNVNNLYKFLNKLDPQDVDYYMINNLKMDLYKKQIIDKIFADLDIRNEEEKNQNIGLVKSILENCQNKFDIIQYIISTKIAFINKETKEIKQSIPSLPKADKFIEIQAPKKLDLQLYLDRKQKITNKQQQALVDKCLSDLGLTMDSFGSLIDYTTIVYQMMTNPVFKPGKDGYKSKYIVFKDINQGKIYKEYPDLPKNDNQIFNIIGQISETDVRNYSMKTLKNIDKKEQIKKYYLKLDIDPSNLSEQDENVLIKYIKESNPKWTLVKFPKLRKIKLMDEMTGETQEYPETFPLGNKILARKNNFDKMYTQIDQLNIYDVKNYVERIQIPLQKKEQLDKYCRALNLSTDEEKKIFIKQLQQIVDKKLPSSWVYCRNNQNKKRYFVQRDSNPLKEIEFPPGFPSMQDVMEWKGELPLFTKEDINKYISKDYIKSEKFEQLGQFIKELGIDEENLPSSKNQLEKYLVVEPDSGWIRYYSLRDKKKYFSNNKKGIVQQHPPNYPNEKEKKELHYKISCITEAEITDFLNSKRKDISQDKVDELVNMCQVLGFTTENQKKEGRQVLLRIYNFDQDQIERVKFQQGGEIMYKIQNNAVKDPKQQKKAKESYYFLQYPVKIDKDFLSRQLYIDVEPITREDLETFLSLKPLFDQGKQQQLQQFCINNGFQVDKNNHENAEIVKRGIFKAFTDTQHAWKRIKDIKSGEYKYMQKNDNNKIQDCPCLVDQKDFRQISDNIKLEEIDKFVNTLTLPDKIKQQELRRLQKVLQLKDHNKLKKYKEFFKSRVFDSKNEWDRYLMPKQKNQKKVSRLEDASPISEEEQPALDVVYINRKNNQKQRFLSPMFDNVEDQYNTFQKIENQNYEEQIIRYLKGEKKFELPQDILEDINVILQEFDMTLDKPMKQDYLNIFKQLVQFDHKNFRIEYIQDGKIGYLTENDNGDSLVQKVNPQKDKVYQQIAIAKQEEQRKEYELKRRQAEDEEKQKKVLDKQQRDEKLLELLECNLQASDLTPIPENERYEEMPELDKNLIKAFVQNDHIDDVRDLAHLNVIFQNLGIRNNEYTNQFLDVPVKLCAKYGQGKKRIYWRKRIGYLIYDEKLKRKIFSPFPEGWPNDEIKLSIQLKFDEIRREDVEQFINLDPIKESAHSKKQKQITGNSSVAQPNTQLNEKFQEMEEVCNCLDMREKGDQIIFRDTLLKIFITNPSPTKDPYQRCRKLMSKKVIYQNSKQQITFPPGYPQIEEFDKIEKEIPHFTQHDLNQYLAKTLNKKDTQLVIQTILRRLGIQNGDEEQLQKDLLIDGIFNFQQKNYRLFKNLKDKKLLFRTKKNELFDLPVEYKPLIKKIQERFDITKQKDNEIAIERIQSFYAAKFQDQNCNEEFDISHERDQISLKNNISSVNKIACLDTELKNLSSKKFKIEIIKCKKPESLYFGVINKDTIPPKKEFSKKNKLPDGIYLTNGKCDEMVGYLDEVNYENFRKKPENKVRNYGFERGDIIHMTVDLFLNQIEFYNLTKKTKYKQKIYLEDFTFLPTVIMTDPNDQITMQPLYDYPLQFALIWHNKDIQFNFQMRCPCNNQLDLNNKLYCTSCNTVIDRVHVQENGQTTEPITHCYFPDVPRVGDQWKYRILYENDASGQKKKDVQYSITAFAVAHDGNSKYQFTSLLKRIGYLDEKKDAQFKYVFKQEQLKVFQIQ